MAAEKYVASVRDSIINLSFDVVVRATKAAIEEGVNPYVVIREGMLPGMTTVGEKFEKGEYFLSELVVAAEVMKAGLKVVVPHLRQGSLERMGSVILATVEGDYHDIGKSIVMVLLEIQGFKVVDLGVDVSTDKIVNAVKRHRPNILGLSALLTLTMPKMGEVIEALKRANLREKVQVILGGAPVTSEFAENIDADYGTNSAPDGVSKCVKWVTSERRN